MVHSDAGLVGQEARRPSGSVIQVQKALLDVKAGCEGIRQFAGSAVALVRQQSFDGSVPSLQIQVAVQESLPIRLSHVPAMQIIEGECRRQQQDEFASDLRSDCSDFLLSVCG